MLENRVQDEEPLAHGGHEHHLPWFVPSAQKGVEGMDSGHSDHAEDVSPRRYGNNPWQQIQASQLASLRNYV